MAHITEDVRAAIERLIAIAKRDTGQSRKVANFLLAWWNATENCGFDLTDMWGCDRAIVDDMITVFAYVAHNQRYPDSLGYAKDFADIIHMWRGVRR